MGQLVWNNWKICEEIKNNNLFQGCIFVEGKRLVIVASKILRSSDIYNL